jgi:hypothetical protein
MAAERERGSDEAGPNERPTRTRRWVPSLTRLVAVTVIRGKWPQPAQRNRKGQASPTGVDSGRLAADLEREGDLAGPAARALLGVQQRLDLPPDAVTVLVELHRRDPVDGPVWADRGKSGNLRHRSSRLPFETRK